MNPGSKSKRRRQSAGILLHRMVKGQIEVLLVHPGGPFWARRDAGVWSIPKGEYEPEEEAIIAARREFAEELGTDPPTGEMLDLGEIQQKSGKRVRAWALAGDLDAEAIRSNNFTLEWPPRSGRMREFPEVDRAAWFGLHEAREKINPGQAALLDRLQQGAPALRDRRPSQAARALRDRRPSQGARALRDRRPSQAE
jgi:predicted NUDIX family NTP pyrophosphohydrolase